MKSNTQQQTGFVTAFNWISLSIITLGLPITVEAQEQSLVKLACQTALNTSEQKPQAKQVQKLAQFADTSQERSQLIQQANNLYNQRDFQGAAKTLCQLLKKSPQDTFVNFQLGNVFARLNQPEAAISAYREAIRRNSKYALAYNGIGVVYASQSRWEDAIAEYKKALEINPNYGEALVNYGQALWQINQKEQARASLEKALSIFKSQNRNERVYQVEQILQQIKTLDNPGIS
jgi:tetratricopeptide (TPR) repeat protein